MNLLVTHSFFNGAISSKIYLQIELRDSHDLFLSAALAPLRDRDHL